MRPNLWRVILGGFVGTAVMTGIMYLLAPLVLSEPPDIATMLDGAAYWLPAILLHFINGSVTLPLAYAYLAFRFLPGQPWLRGALWGVILWGLAELLVMPLMGAGPFSDGLGSVTVITMMALLSAHLAYGTLLGWMAGDAGEQSEHGVAPTRQPGHLPFGLVDLDHAGTAGPDAGVQPLSALPETRGQERTLGYGLPDR